MTQEYSTLRIRQDDPRIMTAVIDAPPMNLIGPAIVRDLVGLLDAMESDDEVAVLVLESADPDFSSRMSI